MRRTNFALAALAAIGLLGACGGGGSGGDDDNAARLDVSYDADRAWQSLHASPRSYSASGRGSDGREYGYTLQLAPQGASTYPRTGAPAMRVNRQSALSAPGLAPVVDIGALFFIGSFLLIGLSSGESCSDVEMPFGPSPFALLGGGAPLFTSIGFPDCTPGSGSDGSRGSTSWSIDIYSGDVYFCLNATQRDSAGATSLRQSTCLQINPSGGLGPKIRFTLEIPGENFSLVARGG